jgi:hypothetical protein
MRYISRVLSGKAISRSDGAKYMFRRFGAQHPDILVVRSFLIARAIGSHGNVAVNSVVPSLGQPQARYGGKGYEEAIAEAIIHEDEMLSSGNGNGNGTVDDSKNHPDEVVTSTESHENIWVQSRDLKKLTNVLRGPDHHGHTGVFTKELHTEMAETCETFSLDMTAAAAYKYLAEQSSFGSWKSLVSSLDRYTPDIRWHHIDRLRKYVESVLDLPKTDESANESDTPEPPKGTLEDPSYRRTLFAQAIDRGVDKHDALRIIKGENEFFNDAIESGIPSEEALDYVAAEPRDATCSGR